MISPIGSQNLYEDNDYLVAKSKHGNIYAWQHKSIEIDGVEGGYLDDIRPDELPDDIKQEVLKEII